jgi:hypothetical protein
MQIFNNIFNFFFNVKLYFQNLNAYLINFYFSNILAIKENILFISKITF